MRFLLFQGPIESLNHFIGELNTQLINLGHECYISDVCHFDANAVLHFCSSKVHGAICYDGISALDKELYDSLDIPMINILMDHPMSFAGCMKDPPQKYIQLMPDEDHVKYAKRFYHIENAFFLPHMASISMKNIPEVPEAERKISVFFPAGYRSVNKIYEEINERFKDALTNKLALQILEYLIADPNETMEKAVEICSTNSGIHMSDELLASFLDHAKLLDHFIRMYYRRKVLTTIIESDIPITVLGGNWNRFEPAQASNVTILPQTDFGGVFPYMKQAKITLNVMPWFKAGTHDRIFNSLMNYSCPLTDPSSWLVKNFVPDKECAYYSLEHLDELPDKIDRLLKHSGLRSAIIQNGREKVENNYTSKQITEMILQYLKQCYEVNSDRGMSW